MSDDLDELENELEESGTSLNSGNTSGKRLTEAEWAQVKRLWELGATTLNELADRFKVRSDTLQKRLKKEGVVKGARATEVGDEVEEEVKNQAQINARRIQETKEQHYSYADALAKLIMQEVLDAKRNGQQVALRDANLAALNKAVKGLEVVRKERYALLGLDKEDGDPDEIPELLISELTEQQIADIQAELRGEPSSDLSDLENIDVSLDDGIVVEGD